MELSAQQELPDGVPRSEDAESTGWHELVQRRRVGCREAIREEVDGNELRRSEADPGGHRHHHAVPGAAEKIEEIDRIFLSRDGDGNRRVLPGTREARHHHLAGQIHERRRISGQREGEKQFFINGIDF